MRSPFPLVLLCAFWAAGVQESRGLTIFRIGGADAPPPQIEVPYQFVQLDWAGVDNDRYGSTELLEIEPGYIEPQQLDASLNLTPLIEAQGGEIRILTWIGITAYQASDALMFDGDPNTAYLGDGNWGGDYGVIKNKVLIFDLGGRFNLQRLRFFPRERFKNDRFVERFLIGINDGNPLRDGERQHLAGWRGSSVDFDIIHDVAENTEALIDLEFPPGPVRQILFEAPENTRGIWEIAEFEIYGAGYAPFSGYVSNVIDLGAEASLGAIRWSGRRDEGAKMEITARSGDDPDPNNYWRQTFRGTELSRFDAQGRPLTLKTYKSLESGEKGGVTHDTENWEFWSTPFDFAQGQAELGGSKPRRYVQVRVDFQNSKVAGGRVEYVEFAASIPPIASGAVAEIAPSQAIAGQATAFTYKLLPRLRGNDLGFDSIEISTPAEPLSIDAVRLSGQPVSFEVLRRDAQGFEVRLPRIDAQRTEELVEVDFRAEVFKYGTVFAGRVFDSQQPHEVRQQVTAGDADKLVDSNALSVELMHLGQATIGALRLVPASFTPNGDGINDQVGIEYDLLNLDGEVPLVIELYDLAGAYRGRVYEGRAASGRFVARWDGGDGQGRLVPPGLYLLRLRVEADREAATATRLVGVAH